MNISMMVFLFSIPSMVDFRTEWRILACSLSFQMLSLSFAFLLSVGFVIETRLEKGLGTARMSRTLDQIGGTSGFHDLCSIVWDYK